MPNVNIPETEKNKLLWTHQVKKIRQPLNKKMMSMLVSEMALQHPGRYEKYEMTADMTENRQYWKMMVKTGPQRCGNGLKR